MNKKEFDEKDDYYYIRIPFTQVKVQKILVFSSLDFNYLIIMNYKDITIELFKLLFLN